MSSCEVMGSDIEGVGDDGDPGGGFILENEVEVLTVSDGQGMPPLKKPKLDPYCEIVDFEISDVPFIESNSRTAFPCLEAVRELEHEAALCMLKHKEDLRRSDEARSRVRQASNAVNRAEEAARIAKKAQRKAENSFRMAEELARVSKFVAEEAQARYSELQAQWDKDLESNLCRVLVQKNTVAHAFRELQDSAGCLSLVPMKDMVDDAYVTQLESLVKGVNACWLRLTIERRKFTESLSNVKCPPP